MNKNIASEYRRFLRELNKTFAPYNKLAFEVPCYYNAEFNRYSIWHYRKSSPAECIKKITLKEFFLKGLEWDYTVDDMLEYWTL